jgi:hypothetical protein
MRHHNSNDKRPRTGGVAPREHYIYHRSSDTYKSKKKFENEASAWNWVNSRYRHPEEVTVYQCSICHKFHISTKQKDNGENDNKAGKNTQRHKGR